MLGIKQMVRLTQAACIFAKANEPWLGTWWVPLQSPKVLQDTDVRMV